MKLRKIIIMITLSVSVFLSSCEDFLTQESISKASTSEMYQSIADCEYGLAAMYNAFKAMSVYNLSDELMRSDMATPGNRTSTSSAYVQDFTNAHSSASNKWAAIYTVIFRANQLIEGVDELSLYLKTDLQVEQLSFYKAQGLFMRGLMYFWLHYTFNFGSVPLVTKASQSPDDIFYPCSDADEVEAFFRSDLENAAYQYEMYDSWSEDTLWTGIATTASAVTVLAMSYLYEASHLDSAGEDGSAQYAMAADLFKSVIDSGDFELASIDENHTAVGEFNSESILEVNYTTEYNSDYTSSSNYLYNTYNMTFSNLGYTTCVPAFWLWYEFKADPVDPLNPMNWTASRLDEDGDLVFSLCGNEWEYSSVSGDVESFVSYVYRTVKDGDDIVTEQRDDGFTYLTFQNTYLNTKTVKYTTTEVDGDVTVTKGSPSYSEITAYNKAVRGIGEYDTANIRLVSKGDTFEDWNVETRREYTLRKSYTIADYNDKDLEYYLEPTMFTGSFANGSPAYFRGMTNWETVADEDDTVPTQTSAINLRLLRLTDVYLMYAECLLEQGRDINEALMYINRIRYRAGAKLLGASSIGEYSTTEATYDGATYTYSSLIEHIRYVERPLELTTYGQSTRVCDLRRWGVTKERFEYLSKNVIVYTGTITMLKENSTTGGLSTSTPSTGKFSPDEAEAALSADPDIASWWGTSYLYDYVDAAKNYTDADNSYWKIPIDEVLANPYISN